MSDPAHLERLRAGIADWNAWRLREREVAPDLSGADLRGAVLVGAHLARADLRNANLDGANLGNANLGKADLSGATLRGATLYGAIVSTATLTRCDLTRAHLRDAQLNGTILDDAILAGADLRGAFLTHARLQRCNVTEAKCNGANFAMAQLTGADLSGATVCDARFNRANLSQARLIETDLEGSSLVDTCLAGATLTRCPVYGVNVWNVDLTGARQVDLIVSPASEPVITVDDLEVAQFIYLLLNNQKIRNVINTVTAKAVLILGRFSTERKPVLDALRTQLRRLDLLPIMFDFERPATRSLEETVTTLARLSRFIIADITDPGSIPQELTAIVQALPSVPVQPLLLEGHEPWAMFESIVPYPWVLPLVTYKTIDDLLFKLDADVVAPAAQRADSLLSDKSRGGRKERTSE